jgi:transcriptional regulator GlxA family with amidase domain
MAVDSTSDPARRTPSPVRHDVETAEKIEQTISYMMDHLDHPLQVATLAAMACVSPSHYFALFKRRTGSAPMDYFTRLRMERARKLLDSTTRSVKEVAAALGYDDPFYFSRVFKSVNHVAPSYYRQQQLSQSALQPRAEENSPCETSFRPFRREEVSK